MIVAHLGVGIHRENDPSCRYGLKHPTLTQGGGGADGPWRQYRSCVSNVTSDDMWLVISLKLSLYIIAEVHP